MVCVFPLAASWFGGKPLGAGGELSDGEACTLNTLFENHGPQIAENRNFGARSGSGYGVVSSLGAATDSSRIALQMHSCSSSDRYNHQGDLNPLCVNFMLLRPTQTQSSGLMTQAYEKPTTLELSSRYLRGRP